MSEWQETPPEVSGYWLMSCMETDGEADRVKVYFKGGKLWAKDPYLWPMPLKDLYEGLTNVSWRFDPDQADTLAKAVTP